VATARTAAGRAKPCTAAISAGPPICRPWGARSVWSCRSGASTAAMRPARAALSPSVSQPWSAHRDGGERRQPCALGGALREGPAPPRRRRVAAGDQPPHRVRSENASVGWPQRRGGTARRRARTLPRPPPATSKGPSALSSGASVRDRGAEARGRPDRRERGVDGRRNARRIDGTRFGKPLKIMGALGLEPRTR